MSERTTKDFPVRAVMVTDNGELIFSKTFLMAVRKNAEKPQGQFVVEVLKTSDKESFLLKHSQDLLRFHQRDFLKDLESFMFARSEHIYMVLERVEEEPLPSVEELLYS